MSTSGMTQASSLPSASNSQGSTATSAGDTAGSTATSADDTGGSAATSASDTTGGSAATSASDTGGSAATSASDTQASDTSSDGSGGADGGTGDTDEETGNSGDPLSPGCGTAFQAPPPDGQQQTLDINGDTRYYLMDVPDNADNETPLMLVLALHGFDMNNIAVVDLFNFTERSGGQAITVWPQGEGPHPGDVPHWGDHVLESTWSSNEQNYTFLSEIITTIGERYCIDQERIFIAGFSMGAFFTNQLACDHSDWFRAFAPVAGGGPNCQDPDVLSAIMLQHGTADEIVLPSSGEDSRDFWVEQNGCDATSSVSLQNCQFYDGCAEGKPVAWCTGNYDHYIPDEVASNIWSFFSSF